MKNPKSTNRLFDLDQQLESERQSPPPPTESSTSGSGSLFNLDKAVGKPNQQLQPRNHPSPPSPSGSGFLFDLDQSVAEPNQPTQSQNHPPQIRSFDDGSPIEMVTAEEDNSPMEAQAFDFNEPIVVQEENYTKASSWDEDYTEASPWDEDHTTASSGKDYTKEMATGSVPFEATHSFEPEQQVSYAAESPKETSSHAEGLAKEMEVLRQKVRSLEQPAASTAPASPDSEVLGDRLQDIRNEIKQLQWQKQQQPKGNTEAIADQIKAIREELQSLRQSREDEHLSQEDWEALELEPTFQDFDQKIDEEQSPSKLEAAHYAPVEVVPPEAPHPQARAMEVGLSQQFAEFDRMMDEETTDAIELAEGLEYGSGIGTKYASQLGVENIYMYLNADRTENDMRGSAEQLSKQLVTGEALNQWQGKQNGKGTIILYQGKNIDEYYEEERERINKEKGLEQESLWGNDKEESKEHEQTAHNSVLKDEIIQRLQRKQQVGDLKLAPLALYPLTKSQNGAVEKLEGIISVSQWDNQRIQIYNSTEPNAEKLTSKKAFGNDDYQYEIPIPKEGIVLGMAAKRYDMSEKDKEPIKIRFTAKVNGKEVGRQTAQIRVAPWIMPHVLCPIEEVYMSVIPEPKVNQEQKIKREKEEKKEEFVGLKDKSDEEKKKKSYEEKWRANIKQRNELNSIVYRTLSRDIRELQIDEDKVIGKSQLFVQDAVEIGYSYMPGESVHNTSLRSPNPRWEYKIFPHHFPNEISAVELPKLVQSSTSMSFGNLEVTPPTKGYPLGRIYYSKGYEEEKEEKKAGRRFDPKYMKFLEAQRVQKPFTLDASWLQVGHVDEMVCFLPVKDELVACVASPKKAIDLVKWTSEIYPHSVLLKERKIRWNKVEVSMSNHGKLAQMKIDAEKCQKKLNEVKDKLREELKEITIIDIPVLFELSGKLGGGYVALTSNMVNMLPVGKTCIFPKPYGPIKEKEHRKKDRSISIEIGSKYVGNKEEKLEMTFDVHNMHDVFEEYMLAVLKKFRLEGESIDVWDGLHQADGEIHCGTYAWRNIPDREVPWWVLWPEE